MVSRFKHSCDHEAGHAVVATILCRWVEKVDVSPAYYYDESNDDNPTTSYNIRNLRVMNHIFSENKRLDKFARKDECLISLAGAITNSLLSGTSLVYEATNGGCEDFEYYDSMRSDVFERRMIETENLLEEPYVLDAIQKVSYTLRKNLVMEQAELEHIVHNVIPDDVLHEIRRKYKSVPDCWIHHVNYFDWDDVWYGHKRMDELSEVYEAIVIEKKWAEPQQIISGSVIP